LGGLASRACGPPRLRAPARCARRRRGGDPEARPGTGPLGVRMRRRHRHPVPDPRVGCPPPRRDRRVAREADRVPPPAEAAWPSPTPPTPASSPEPDPASTGRRPSPSRPRAA
jgi:hypothetical protein